MHGDEQINRQTGRRLDQPDPVPVGQDLEGAPDLILFPGGGPSEDIAKGACHFFHQRTVELTEVGQQGTAQEQVVEMDDLLTLRHLCNPSAGVVRVSLDGAPYADGQGFGVGFAGQAKEGQGAVGGLLGEGPEGGPFGPPGCDGHG
jgi:hypothetical protein